MASGNGTKCKTYFGGPRKILHAHWKLRFAYSSHTTFHKDVMWATVNVQNSDWHSSADVWSLFFFLAWPFFSVSEAAADGREGDGKVGGAERDGKEGTALLASTGLRQELGPTSELRRSDFSGGRRWPITFPSMFNMLITSGPVTASSKLKTLAVPEATFTDMLKFICK